MASVVWRLSMCPPAYIGKFLPVPVVPVTAGDMCTTLRKHNLCVRKCGMASSNYPPREAEGPAHENKQLTAKFFKIA
jgi:hypothetical protein